MSVASQGVKVEIEAMKWGMVLPNSTDIVINGRIEEITQKPFFRGLLETKRCVVCVQGYFEWTQEGEKIPYLIKSKNLPDATVNITNSKLKSDTTADDFDAAQILWMAGLYNNAF